MIQKNIPYFIYGFIFNILKRLIDIVTKYKL